MKIKYLNDKGLPLECSPVIESKLPYLYENLKNTFAKLRKDEPF